MGARSGANQDQQCDTADELIRERLLLATSLPKAGFVTLQIVRSTMDTDQPFFFASSCSAGVKAPTLVSGRPCAGP